MTEYDLLITPYGRVNFAPENQVQEILQNVYTIITTQKFTVPLDREFGLKATMLDAPMLKARAALKAEIVQAVRIFEPRAKVTKINFESTLDGNLYIKLKIALL